LGQQLKNMSGLTSLTRGRWQNEICLARAAKVAGNYRNGGGGRCFDSKYTRLRSRTPGCPSWTTSVATGVRQGPRDRGPFRTDCPARKQAPTGRVRSKAITKGRRRPGCDSDQSLSCRGHRMGQMGSPEGKGGCRGRTATDDAQYECKIVGAEWRADRDLESGTTGEKKSDG